MTPNEISEKAESLWSSYYQNDNTTLEPYQIREDIECDIAAYASQFEAQRDELVEALIGANHTIHRLISRDRVVNLDELLAYQEELIQKYKR